METDTPTDKESEGHAQLHERERELYIEFINMYSVM